MEIPRKTLAVIMQRRAIRNRWESVQWEPWSVIESDEPAGVPRVLIQEPGLAQWLHPGFALELHRDEAEGYYLNVSSGSPRIFVFWRMDGEAADESAARACEDAARACEDAARGVPLQVTASYYEGGRWLDAGHSVDSVPMTPEMFAWVGTYVEQNYRPEPRKRIKPRSFMHPKDRPSR